MNKETITIELTKDEHMLITAILMMQTTGITVPIHPDKMPMLTKVAMDFNMRNIKVQTMED